MRDTTERPKGIEAGTLKLTGTDEETIYRMFTELLDNQTAYVRMAHALNPYGDRRAGPRSQYFTGSAIKAGLIDLDPFCFQAEGFFCKAFRFTVF